MKQLKDSFNDTFGKEIQVPYEFKSVISLCRPVTPDDLPIVGNLSKSQNVYLHNGMGGFGNASVGTAKLLADMIIEDKKNSMRTTKAKYEFLSPHRFNLW